MQLERIQQTFFTPLGVVGYNANTRWLKCRRSTFDSTKKVSSISVMQRIFCTKFTDNVCVYIRLFQVIRVIFYSDNINCFVGHIHRQKIVVTLSRKSLRGTLHSRRN